MPKLAGEKSLPPIQTTWSYFFGRQNNVLRVWQKKSTDDDDDGWHDNYDGDDNYIDEIDEKNYNKKYKYYDFWVKIAQF